ncbi:hypothetical protein RRG08_037347 [Elysia crispata]|uniref:Uncharacterized protein n=1 Tax=Elysia crispata TaxID=231223 RepID=A0AAE0Z1U0_9GAST|nr:hypothetical protein RRG08_017053 [Elysia crispata]KAK3784269.1 hypothetical protein RRG08_037347 [Elysia crispata]
MHMPGTQIPISDALSRAPTKDEEAQLLEEVCNLSLIDVPDHRLNEISSSHSNTVNSSPQPLPTIVNSSPPPLPVPTMPPIEPLCSPTPNQVVYEHTPDCEDIAPFPQEHQSTQSTQYTTRSGRTIKKPNKYTE